MNVQELKDKLGTSTLIGANLEDAILTGAILIGANLDGANLTGANLTGAILTGAYLRGANLEGANLEGANLEGVDLEGAYLRGVRGKIITTFQRNRHFAYSCDENIKIGCEYHLVSYWKNNYDEIGTKAGYSADDIKHYGAWINSL